MAATVSQAVPSRATTRRAYVRLILSWILLPLFFLVTGGSLDWWQAWVYCALILVPGSVFMMRRLRTDPESVERRFKMKEKERTQRRVLLWGLPVTLALFILPGLDRRFGWSHPALAVVVAAQVLVFVSYLAILKVLAVNRWAGRTIETIAGQQVVSTGPYALVRHPMYAAGVVFYTATAVALGSSWAVIPGLLYVLVFVVRIGNEEEVLLRELPGYEAYRASVRYRLIPRVW